MDIEDELEALEATFSTEIQWQKVETSGKEKTYTVDFLQGKQTILTLNIDG